MSSMLSHVARLQVRRKNDNRWTKCAAALGMLALLVAVAGLALHQIGTSWKPAIVVAAFAPELMWAAPIGALLFALARRWIALVAAGVLVVLAVGTQAPLYLSSAPVADGLPLVVLQANLRVGSANPEVLAREVQAQHVDVLMTEELTYEERDRLVAAGIAAKLPYRFDAAKPNSGAGLALWSRFPLSRETRDDGFELGVVSARMTLPSGVAVTVVAVHLLSPYRSPTGEWLAEIGRLHSLLRGAVLDGRPVIVGGDFNATPDHEQFRNLLTDGYHDADSESGAGYLATYPADQWFPPVLAIDHVLVKGASATSASTVALPGSDHRGLLVHIVLS